MFWRRHPTKQQMYGHQRPITKTIQIRGARHTGFCWRNKDELISEPLHMDEKKLDDQLENINKILMTNTGCTLEDLRWTMKTNVERGSGKSMLSERHDDDDSSFVFTLLKPFLLLLFKIGISVYQDFLSNSNDFPTTS